MWGRRGRSARLRVVLARGQTLEGLTGQISGCGGLVSRLPQPVPVWYATAAVRRRFHVMMRSARSATLFVWNMLTICCSTGCGGDALSVMALVGLLAISSDASRLMS